MLLVSILLFVSFIIHLITVLRFTKKPVPVPVVPFEEWKNLKARVADLDDGKIEQLQEELAQLQRDFIAATKINTAVLEVVNKLPSVDDFARLRNLAENAYDMCLGTIPDAGISAKKVDGAIITTGLPNA